MLEYIGKYNKGTILIDAVDESVVTQLYSVLNNPAFKNSNIVIMPDTHMGNGVMVGFTMTANDYIVPSVIGGDIGCGVVAYNLGRIKPKCDKLDDFIRNNISYGARIHDKSAVKSFDFKDIIKRIDVNEKEILCSLGSLGGGNHFIELDKDDDQNIWLVIHSGSRNFGLQVAKYHQNQAKKVMKEIYGAGAYYKMEYLPIGKGGQEYLKDVFLAKNYASLNRKTIAQFIIEKFFKLQFSKINKVESIHNYINPSDKIIRKGAISAHPNEPVIIPINRAFGCIIGVGKSSVVTNYSAPHGAGRLFSRVDSKNRFSMEEYEKQMQGIFSTSVSRKTIDESPMVYKKPKFILKSIQNIVDVTKIIKTIYSFKAD